MDKIFIHALKTEAIIGIFDWERQVKQTVVIDIEISADIRKAALSDSIADTLNYKRIAKRVLTFVEARPITLQGDADIPRTADRPRLAQHDADPGDAELLEDQHGDVFG